MSMPGKPKLPDQAPTRPPAADPDPRHRPDERKEGGPDFGKAGKQQRNKEKAKEDAGREEAEP
ncbi:MAG TPA: hypothetical protein VGM87_12765 [Roseomonas sp.]|jgi:hypothetical protein